MDDNIEEIKRLKIELIEKINDEIKNKKFYMKFDAFFACFCSLLTILTTHGLYNDKGASIFWTLLLSLEAAIYSISWSNKKRIIREKNEAIGFIAREIGYLDTVNSK